MKKLSKNEIWVRFAVACYNPDDKVTCTIASTASNAAEGADALYKEYLKRFPEEKTLLKEGI